MIGQRCLIGAIAACSFLVLNSIRADERPQPMPDTPLAIKATRAFLELKFFRPVLLTHAGDGTNRLFVASQKGKIHVFPNQSDVDAPLRHANEQLE